MRAELPPNEEARLLALYRLEVLDTPREQNFDDIAHLAMSICDAPIAVVSLVDRDRQWFKSCVGLDGTETPRDLAFCAHAILAPTDILMVEDATRDARFSDNPLVTGDPFIRFYAGAPLITKSGEALGTLCVVDRRPRKLTRLQQDTLKLLANQVMQLLELRESNIALQQERENVEDVIKGANLGTWRWNVQTGESIFNERWANMLGYTLTELAPVSINTWLTLCHPEDLKLSSRLIEQHFRGELEHYECYCRMEHKSGDWVYVYARGRVINFTPDGKPLWMSGTHSDMTELHRSYDAIELNEKKLSTLYNQAPIAIALNNYSTGKYIECNPEFCRLLGYNQQEIFSLGYEDITPEEYVGSDYQQLESLHVSSRYGPYEKHLIHRDGRLIPVLLNGVLIENSTGERQVWSFIQDITERKRIEQMKNEFVSAVSHELRTPLTSISGSLGMVVGGMLGELPANMKNMLSIAQKNALRLTLLINDLLDMEKLLAGQMAFDMRTQSLLPIVEQSVESNSSYADTFSVHLVLHASIGDEQVHLDAQRLQQVLANFISNAVKFSPAKGQVDILVSREGNRVKVAVADHGPGISDEFRARIFQKFSQADSSDSRQRGGTGLGLAISKAFVERMQGTIGFDSVPGKGATFFATFPIHVSRDNIH